MTEDEIRNHPAFKAEEEKMRRALEEYERRLEQFWKTPLGQLLQRGRPRQPKP